MSKKLASVPAVIDASKAFVSQNMHRTATEPHTIDDAWPTMGSAAREGLWTFNAGQDLKVAPTCSRQEVSDT